VHVDLSLVQAVASCTEQLLMYWFHQTGFPAASRRGRDRSTGPGCTRS
jgi:hypothetical protein